MLPVTLATGFALQDRHLEKRRKSRTFAQELQHALDEDEQIQHSADEPIEIKSRIGGKNVTIKIQIESIAADDSYISPPLKLPISDIQILSDLRSKSPAHEQRRQEGRLNYRESYLRSRSILPYLEHYQKVKVSI